VGVLFVGLSDLSVFMTLDHGNVFVDSLINPYG